MVRGFCPRPPGGMVTLGSGNAAANRQRGQRRAESHLLADPSRAANELRSLLHALAFYGRFSGTVLVARGDTVVYEESFGFSSWEQKKHNTNASVYHLGSIAKGFTAAGIMRLIEGGELRLDQPLSQFFPRLGPAARAITLHHLLTMSSGIRQDLARTKNYDRNELVLPQATPIAAEDLVHRWGELKLFFRPGRRFDYSNLNYALLAAIIEQVSGVDLHTYLQRSLFTPLDLPSLAFGRENADSERVATGYVGLPQRHVVPEPWHDSWLLGAGGVYASARDLYRWMRALNEGLVFGPTATETLLRPHQRDGRRHYAYGWFVEERTGGTYRYHEGGTVGYIGEAGFFAEENVYLVLLSNHTHELERIAQTVVHMQGIARQIHAILAGRPHHAPPVPAPGAQASLAGPFAIGGARYRALPGGGAVQIVAEDPSPSLMDVPFRQDLVEESRRFRRARAVARALAKDRFGLVLWRSELALAIAIAARLVAKAWQALTGDKGAPVSLNCYRLPSPERPRTYGFRLVHANREIGVLLTFNRWGRVRGIHLDPSFSFQGPREVLARAIADDHLFIDGFALGYPDLHIRRDRGRWVFKAGLAELPLDEVQPESLPDQRGRPTVGRDPPRTAGIGRRVTER